MKNDNLGLSDEAKRSSWLVAFSISDRCCAFFMTPLYANFEASSAESIGYLFFTIDLIVPKAEGSALALIVVFMLMNDPGSRSGQR